MSKEKQIENCKQELLNALGLRINEEFKIKGNPYTFKIDERYHVLYDRPNTTPPWTECDYELVDLSWHDIITLNQRGELE